MAKIDYWQIISQAKELTFKHKWLWVYGLALVISGAGASSNFRFPSNNSSKKLPENIPQNLPENVKNVLGATTDALSSWFMSIPASTWIIFILVFLASICLSVIISAIVSNWAKGALIYATAKASSSPEPLTLGDTSPAGRKYMKNLFVFSLLSGIISLVIIGGLSLPITFLFILKSALLKILLSLIFVPMVIIVSMFLVFIDYSGQRLIVLHNQDPFAALKRGWRLAKNHFIPSFKMSIVNSLVGCSIGCLVTIAIVLLFGVFGLLVFMPNILYHSSISGFQIAISILLIFIISHLNLLVSAILQVFNYQVWTLFINQIIAEEKNL